jgi:predicted NUDIX family phosphoesterase
MDEKEELAVIPAALAQELVPAPFTLFRLPEFNIMANSILSQVHFMERGQAEHNSAFKQLVVYIMLRHKTDFLITQRSSKDGEKRLHGLYSIGQGGHLNMIDFASNGNVGPILCGLAREIAEEYHMSGPLICAPMGIINDNSTEVGRVHLGLVYSLMLNEEELARLALKDEPPAEVRWASPVVLAAYYDRMENWSRILVDRFIRPLYLSQENK